MIPLPKKRKKKVIYLTTLWLICIVLGLTVAYGVIYALLKAASDYDDSNGGGD